MNENFRTEDQARKTEREEQKWRGNIKKYYTHYYSRGGHLENLSKYYAQYYSRGGHLEKLSKYYAQY